MFVAYGVGQGQVNRERHKVGKIIDTSPGTPRRVALAFISSAALLGVTLSAVAQQNVGGGGSGGTSTVFATGNFILPEQVAAAPGIFGSGYLVSDADADTIYEIAPNGGAATVFSANGFRDFAGTQLSSYYNGTALAGQYLEVGTNLSSTNGIVDTISANGTATSVINAANSWFAGAATASSKYGSIQSGQLLIVNEVGGANGAGEIDVLNKNGTLSTFASLPQASTLAAGASTSTAFDVGFAPSSFGSHAGELFASDATSGNLYVINAEGQSSLFAQITLPAGAQSPGLRQFAWAPSGFGQYSGDLFVSIAAENGGGGELGEIEVFNANGQEVALYDQGSGTNPLDARGLLFTTIDGQTELLAANADPEIDVITPANFTGAAPEIDASASLSSLTLLLGAVVVLTGAHRRQVGSRTAA
jgi:hypothetical protein